MSRPLRLEMKGCWYHVAGRGNERKDIFRDDAGRVAFFGLVGKLDKADQHRQRHGLGEKPTLEQIEGLRRGVDETFWDCVEGGDLYASKAFIEQMTPLVQGDQQEQKAVRQKRRMG